MVNKAASFHFGLCPPAGNPVVGEVAELGSATAMLSYPGYQSRFVDSGTSALALACLSSRHLAGEERVEVIVPSYGCPDLIAAVHYAGLVPLLVDIHTDYHGYDLIALGNAISKRTLAVIAVNFLGIPEQLGLIAELLAGAKEKIYLIEDNAQWLPEYEGRLVGASLHGDFVLTSFGRGKPLSLLGGGVLFTKEGLVEPLLNLQRGVIIKTVNTGAKFHLKRAAYNLLLNPLFYRCLDTAPFMQLGATVYHPQTEIAALSPEAEAILPSNLNLYLKRSRNVEQLWRNALAETALDMAVDLAPVQAGRMLRFPVLARSQLERDTLLQKLKRVGIGASPMYQTAMPYISGVDTGMYSLAAKVDNAMSFGARLLTLPCHSGVAPAEVERAVAVFTEV